MKTILTFGVLTVLALSAFGQGQINFNNRVTTATPNPVDAKIYIDTVGGVLPGAGGIDSTFRAALLGGAVGGTGSTTNSIGTLSLLASPSTAGTWVTVLTGTLAGYLAVGTDSACGSGLPFGSSGLFQVVAWQGTETTWDAAYTDWKQGLIKAGFSNPFASPTTTSATDLNVQTLQGLTS